MTITKQLESEIKRFMDNYWDTYFKGDLETWSTFITDDYKNIGGTEEEIWNSKKEIIDYTKAIIDQMIGAAEIRNKKIQIFPLAPFILAHEFCDMYIKVENDWTFYGKFRLSSILKKGETGWQVVHQHGSYPDAKTEQGEAFAFDKISTENKELKDAIKRRTIELENKTWELKIEASLERVRTVAMSMHKPGDLMNICQVLFHELFALGFKDIRNALIHIFNDEKGYYYDYDYSDFTGGKITHLPYEGNRTMEEFLTQVRRSDDAFVEVTFDGKELQDWKAFRIESGQIDDKRIDAATQLNYYFYSFGAGNIGFSNFGTVDNDKLEILKRFRNVFDFSYRRYLEIERAAAQAREAQIEIGVERVRSKSLAMHRTSELQDVIHTVHRELLNLNIAANGGSFIAINNDIDTTLRCWGSGGTSDTSEEVQLPLYEKPFCTNLIHGIKSGPCFFTEEFSNREKKEFFTFLFKHEPWSLLDDKHKKEILLSSGGYTRSCCVSEHTSIFIINHFGETFSDEDNNVLKRFGKVFDQTYTRFLDLQKAEAQASEARTEAALERLRSRSMAMHNSDEVMEVAVTLFDELQNLDFRFGASTIILMDKDTGDMTQWVAGFTQKRYPESFHIHYFKHPCHDAMLEAWKNGDKYLVYHLSGLEKKSYDKELFSKTSYNNFPEEQKLWMQEKEAVVFSLAFMKHGAIHWGPTELSYEQANILQRFANVFEQTYTRFLDLQRAEAQAREARIEAGLERVRSRTMAMQKSSELAETSFVLFQQFEALGESSKQMSIGIFKEGENTLELYSTLYGSQWKDPVSLDLDEPIVVSKIYAAWKEQKKSIVIDISGEDLLKYNAYRKRLSGIDYKEDRWVIHIAFFSQGMLTFSVTEPHPDETVHLLERFAQVFDLTYTRFNDLQKAEAQAREAQIESALEKVRSSSLAMHHSSELEQVAGSLFDRLVELGLSFDGAFIFIFDKDKRNISLWIATNHLSVPTTIELPYDEAVENNRIIKDLWNAIENGEHVISRSYSGEVKNEYFRYVAKYNELKIPETVKQFQIEQESWTAHLVAEKNSMIGFDSWWGHATKEEDFKILIRFARIFEQAYTRFKDLKQAEAMAAKAEEDLVLLKAEKKRTEDALNELQITQRQLIQSEKMASLGELTAGIAHEIQNPLNFVNNFSEVNRELLFEMQEAIDKGYIEEAKQIAVDLIQNEDKIIAHGKRADAIVKGMLQHSRTSSGQKEETDINALADEYLRLAYHGLRAKDKSFNAIIESEYDKGIGMIPIISQDIGRVILNLIANAFYAVTERKKQGDLNYEPFVQVSTKKRQALVEITVKDNGNGIPEHLLDKIFQPFFTTKPSGMGTGLGLSLSYDIIKAHKGELKVKSEKGAGAEFIIQLPA